MSTAPEEDPFSEHNIKILQYITLARIYDVLMAQLTLDSPESSHQILELHREGKLLGPPPAFYGEFMTVTSPAVEE